MVNEAVLVYELELPIAFTCANGTGIEKGTLLTLSDPHTAAGTTTKEAIIAGIAAQEKIASDGKTKIAVYQRGFFKMTASGSIGVGDALISSAGSGGAVQNLVEAAGVDAEDIVGISEEAATTGQTFLMRLNPMTVNLA